MVYFLYYNVFSLILLADNIFFYLGSLAIDVEVIFTFIKGKFDNFLLNYSAIYLYNENLLEGI